MRLSEAMLDDGFAAIQQHGYGSFFPTPPEWQTLVANWPECRDFLSRQDLDTYRVRDPIVTFAPKSHLNIRSVTLLHPYDLVLYTALVLCFRNDIAQARISAQARRVFSFRTEGADNGVLYKPEPSYRQFRARILEKASAHPQSFVGVTDIADFFPSIYQHRLINALDAAAGHTKADIVRVLEKLLQQFSNGTSYGIPVGPHASSLLSEAVHIDVDAALRSEEVDFLRYVDDYVIFATTAERAQAALYFLAEHLHRNHGLKLQPAKTSIHPATEYVTRYHTLHTDKERERREILRMFREGGGYTVQAYDDLTPEQRDALNAYNLSDMLQEALDPTQVVDYAEVGFILGRLSALRMPELIPLVLANIERLYPVAHAVASFFDEFSYLPDAEQRRIGSALIRPLRSRNGVRPPVYYAMWVLDLFARNATWNHATDLLQIYNSSPIPLVRRYAALALGTSGSRAQIVQLKDHFVGAPPLVRSAILIASNKLGNDERRHWRTNLHLTCLLERAL